MADINFYCPHCNQHITCDELWAGRELQCPSCQGALTAPTAAAPAPPTKSSLVPKPPGSGSRLSLGQAGHGGSVAQQPAPQQRSIPIRNLATAAPKKRN